MGIFPNFGGEIFTNFAYSWLSLDLAEMSYFVIISLVGYKRKH